MQHGAVRRKRTMLVGFTQKVQFIEKILFHIFWIVFNVDHTCSGILNSSTCMVYNVNECQNERKCLKTEKITEKDSYYYHKMMICFISFAVSMEKSSESWKETPNRKMERRGMKGNINLIYSSQASYLPVRCISRRRSLLLLHSWAANIFPR